MARRTKRHLQTCERAALDSATLQQTAIAGQDTLFWHLEIVAHDDPAQGTDLRGRAAARQALMQHNLDPRQLHRQLRRRHSRVRQRPAIEATRQSWYVGRLLGGGRMRNGG